MTSSRDRSEPSASGRHGLTRREVLLLLPLGALAACSGGSAAEAPVASASRTRRPSPTGYVVDAKKAGAVGDGVTDDTDALQQALTQIGRRGGGTLLLPAGTYAVSMSLAPPSRVRMLGAPQATATLLDTVGNLTIIDLVDCVDATVEGLRFMGSGTAVVRGRGMVHGAKGERHGPVRCNVLDNVMVDAGTCGVAIANGRDVVVSGNTVQRSAEHGIYLAEDTTGTHVVGNVVEFAGAGQSGTVVGIKLANLGCTRNTVERNSVRYPLSEGVILDVGATRNRIIANSVLDAPARCVRINPGTSGNVVARNLLRGAGGQTLRDLGARGSVIEHNTIDSPAAESGIQLDAASAGATVRGNYVLAVSPTGWGITVSGRGHTVVGNYVAPEVVNRIRVQ